MSDRFDLAGKTAVVTGAASGIGRATAQALAARGCNLAIVDRDEAGLVATAAGVKHKVRISQHVADLAEPVAIAALPAAISEHHDHVDILVNNAGVALAGRFDQASEADFDWLITINFNAAVRLTRAFLPILEGRPQAQIVNVASIFAFLAPPGQTAYASSKFALRGFTDALRHELLERGSTVGVTGVYPGGVATGIAANARRADGMSADQLVEIEKLDRKMLTLPPERAAEKIVEAIERRRSRVVIGKDAKIASLLERLAPTRYWQIIRAFA